jgi:hypothetical protein
MSAEGYKITKEEVKITLFYSFGAPTNFFPEGILKKTEM